MFKSFIATGIVFALFLMPLTGIERVGQTQGQAVNRQSLASSTATTSSAQERIINSATAVRERAGMLLQWRSNSARESLRLHIYRIRTGRRTFEAISADSLSTLTTMRLDSGYSYQWFDPQGTTDSIYYIESANLNGQGKAESTLVSVLGNDSELIQQPPAQARETADGMYLAAPALNANPLASAVAQPQFPESSITNQWVIAAQVALKIQIKTEGWYRVTQQQMVSAGFSPTVDIRNLSLFADGDEFAIRTSKAAGQLGPGDFIEFYGQGLDTLDTDAKIYYLIAGTSAGKRVQSEPGNGLDEIQTPLPAQLPEATGDSVRRGWFAPLLDFRAGENKSTRRIDETKRTTSRPEHNSAEIFTSPSVVEPPIEPAAAIKSGQSAEAASTEPDTSVRSDPVTSAATIKTSVPKTASKTKNRKGARRRRGKSKPRYNHAPAPAAPQSGVALSFDDSVQIRERFNFNTQLSAGFNFFGSSFGQAFPLTKTLAINNLQANPGELARLEVAVQGLSLQSHQVNVLCNNVLIGTITNFFGHDHKVQTFSFLASLLVEGNNQIRLAPVSAGETLGLDHLTLTYPRGYKALNNSLRFTARLAQTFKVDGFSTPNVQLLDISKLSSVTAINPASEVSGSGFAITVPPAPRKKARAPVFGAPELQPLRTLYALPQGQFLTPAGFSLNQPSTLNQSGNAADLLIIAAKGFIPSLASLVAQRQSQGLTVVVADVDDVYDEFSFGAHSTQALKDFLSWARTHWTTPPRYVLLAGDASYDPRGNLATAVTRSQVRQHDSQHPGCADLGDNASDFSMALFPLPRNINFNSTPCSDASGLVISEIYDGGGDKANTYANGYIELYNRGPSAVNVNGWSVQYASATGTTWQVTNLSNATIAPGHYYLVQQAGLGGLFPLTPTPDAIGTVSINRNEGKVALVNSTTPLTGPCPVGASIVDFMGYGSAANCFKGSGPVGVSVDFVPTQQIDTLFGVACSDDTLADFNNDGIPEIPVGRLPARTPAEAALMVSKIVSFTKPVPQTALFVADAQGSYYWNFETHSDELALLVPGNIAKQKIYLATQPSAPACQANIINSINQGPALVNYQGHGNVNVWSGASIFTATDARNLTNGNRLPLVIVADCLNGLFNDPVLEGLGETILKAPHGGGVAAYASSGETIPDGQQQMSIRVFQLLFGQPSMALGDITKQAKGATSDLDVRRTWILLGDPSMKIW